MRIKELLGDLKAVFRYHFRPTGDEGDRTAIRLLHMYLKARQLEEWGIEEPGPAVRQLEPDCMMFR